MNTNCIQFSQRYKKIIKIGVGSYGKIYIVIDQEENDAQ